MAWKNFIQWKGTDVCVDLVCTCGARPHYDGYFLYGWKCGHCGQRWEMGTEVEMKPVDRLVTAVVLRDADLDDRA